ncbi:MAG: hypothetical protein PVI90_11960 [Desulfobacteraceae bacterium]
MIRSYLILNLTSWDYLPLMDRWLYKDHAMETMNQVGPILRRYATYRSVPPPDGASAYGYYNWRMTEHWWAESPFRKGVMGHGSALSEVWPEKYGDALGIPTGEGPRGKKWKGKAPAFIFVPFRPTEDFKGSRLTIADGTILRWVIMFKYPEGVSEEQGDDWYINVHASQVSQHPAVKRFFSFKAVDPSSIVGPFVRVSELWFENHSAWRKAVIEDPPEYTKPEWATKDQYPFLEPDTDFISTFLLERPECDFLRDYRGYNVTA